jgi:5'-nucleotidase
MPFPIDDKLVIAVASSALFSLGKADLIFRQQGEEAYRAYQREHLDDVLAPGVAFPFIRRLLRLNDRMPELRPFEVILLSRNAPETGLRVFRSIAAHGLDISRAAFFSGGAPHRYIGAYGASLFLSANQEDVRAAVDAGQPAGLVLDSTCADDTDDELRVAFDFDGVIADDDAERVYQQSASLAAFHASETAQRWTPLHPGPLAGMLTKLARVQQIERQLAQQNSAYRRTLRTAIVTARSAPAHERVITTLSSWGITVDESFFMGGIEKRRVLEVMRPHLFIDDQLTHLTARGVPNVHIPFGITNRRDPQVQTGPSST